MKRALAIAAFASLLAYVSGLVGFWLGIGVTQIARRMG